MSFKVNLSSLDVTSSLVRFIFLHSLLWQIKGKAGRHSKSYSLHSYRVRRISGEEKCQAIEWTKLSALLPAKFIQRRDMLRCESLVKSQTVPFHSAFSSPLCSWSSLFLLFICMVGRGLSLLDLIYIGTRPASKWSPGPPAKSIQRRNILRCEYLIRSQTVPSHFTLSSSQFS